MKHVYIVNLLLSFSAVNPPFFFLEGMSDLISIKVWGCFITFKIWCLSTYFFLVNPFNFTPNLILTLIFHNYFKH